MYRILSRFYALSLSISLFFAHRLTYYLEGALLLHLKPTSFSLSSDYLCLVFYCCVKKEGEKWWGVGEEEETMGVELDYCNGIE